MLTLLQEIPGIEPTGASIFCREAQGVWPELAPYLDKVAARGAARVGLPTTTRHLSRYAQPDQLPRLVAGCVRATLRAQVAADATTADR